MSKPSYNDDLLDQVWAWGHDKTPSVEIEATLRLTPGGLAAWLREDGRRTVAYNTGKTQRDEADTLTVEEAMLRGAVGYTIERQVMSKAGGVVDLTEEVPPNPTMALKWAERRDKPRWGEEAKVDKAMIAVERLTVINNYLAEVPKPRDFPTPVYVEAEHGE